MPRIKRVLHSIYNSLCAALRISRARPQESQLIHAVGAARNSVAAVLKIHPVQPQQFQATIVGTAWCVVQSRYLVTAHHILNNGQPRDPTDRFFVFVVPQNGPQAFHAPVIAFPLEDANNDMAILEIDPSSLPNVTIPSLPVTFDAQPDGERVLTCGFPAPAITQANVDPNGNWRGGQLFLKSHANEGIISAQYEFGGSLMYELNVGWHHGESGGPICRLEPLAAFSIMQHYRNVQTPHGITAGPHRGIPLTQIQTTLRNLGAVIV